jgi:hypothetical protein
MERSWQSANHEHTANQERQEPRSGVRQSPVDRREASRRESINAHGQQNKGRRVEHVFGDLRQHRAIESAERALSDLSEDENWQEGEGHG